MRAAESDRTKVGLEQLRREPGGKPEAGPSSSTPRSGSSGETENRFTSSGVRPNHEFGGNRVTGENSGALIQSSRPVFRGFRREWR